MAELKRHALGVQQGNPDSLYKFVQDVDKGFDEFRAILGRLKVKFIDTATSNTPAPIPNQAEFDVQGIDGKFLITITNPQDIQPVSPLIMRQKILLGGNPTASPIRHNLQSATDTNFNNASARWTDYGVSEQLSYEIQDPNQTKFWRLRSSFDGKNWTAWQIFSSALTCGPVAVASGFLRSTSLAPNSPINNSNNATVDSIDAGASATIRAYGPGGVGSSWIRYDGQNGATTIPSGTVLGASYTTKYNTMFDPTASIYRAFPVLTQYVSSIQDPLYFAGQLTTVAAGGGGGTSGGGQTSVGGGGHISLINP